jgi:hypothetical protein
VRTAAGWSCNGVTFYIGVNKSNLVLSEIFFSKMFPPASRNAKKYYDKKAKGSDKPETKAKAAPDAKRKASARKPKA